jgi:hypothetical protein
MLILGEINFQANVQKYYLPFHVLHYSNTNMRTISFPVKWCSKNNKNGPLTIVFHLMLCIIQYHNFIICMWPMSFPAPWCWSKYIRNWLLSTRVYLGSLQPVPIMIFLNSYFNPGVTGEPIPHRKFPILMSLVYLRHPGPLAGIELTTFGLLLP